MPKNWCLQTVVLDETPESTLDIKEIKPVNLKGDKPSIFTGRTDARAEAPVFWSSDAKRWLIGKVPDAGKDWGQKEKRASEDEIGWHHRCKEHELWVMVRDREAWRAAVHGVTKSQTRLGNWSTTTTTTKPRSVHSMGVKWYNDCCCHNSSENTDCWITCRYSWLINCTPK